MSQPSRPASVGLGVGEKIKSSCVGDSQFLESKMSCFPPRPTRGQRSADDSEAEDFCIVGLVPVGSFIITVLLLLTSSFF
ncbi:hypothetical protein EYF80_016130 [Liparis tanakae]|uniref:Uncharacterized protein n=1 Tax=Liparis tanakae TaxID=230148 RepID=A0A4Z2I7U0_9TELE|nr:hypothetical protein EYF80_016130 [Liparis tanakae]